MPALQGTSFTLMSGEILGIAGVAHNGQEELGEVLTGQRTLESGEIFFQGQKISNKSVGQIRDLGMGHIPDDRFGEGCAKEAPLSRNMIMGVHRKPPIKRKFLLDEKTIASWTDRLIETYDIRTSHRDMPVSSLSGGNVQKAIVAREMQIATKCLIAEQPSRGIDIRAAEFIYDRFQELKSQDAGVLLISTDLNEILRISDRIIVLYKGKIIGERYSENTSPEELGKLMAGIEI